VLFKQKGKSGPKISTAWMFWVLGQKTGQDTKHPGGGKYHRHLICTTISQNRRII